MPILSRPKGITIYRIKDRLGRVRYDCTIKSKGRTGARTRMALMGLSLGQRQLFLDHWFHGRPVVL